MNKKSKLIRPNFPKLLIISHNALNTKTNMGKTMLSFLKYWDKNSLFQLYFKNELPDFFYGKSFFKITDFHMLKRNLGLKSNEQILNTNEPIYTISEKKNNFYIETIYEIGSTKIPIFVFFRNLIWKESFWFTLNLINWIKDFSPQIVFFPVGGFTFSIKIVIKIVQYFNLPLVLFFGDEYFFLKELKYSFFDAINKNEYRKEFLNLVKLSSFSICATDKMASLYKDKFNLKCTSILTPNFKKCKRPFENPFDITYAGNLGLGRIKSLIDIGLILKKHGFILNIYSNDKRRYLIKELNENNGIRFFGSKNIEEINDIISKSKLLIHTESFESKFIEMTRYSMSTKIAELLSSKVCLFAYGPAEISSIEYLKNSKAAIVATSRKSLENLLLVALNNSKIRNRTLSNASKLSNKNHNPSKNFHKFFNLIYNLTRKN